MTAIEAAAASEQERLGNLSAAQKHAERSAVEACEGERRNLEQGLVAFIEARDAERLALYAKAQARVAALVK
jgi:hypothetical protein